MNCPPSFKGKLFLFEWPYLDLDGKILGYTARYEMNGQKDVIPFFKKQDSTFGPGAADSPRPLFGLNYLASGDQNQTVYIVEGEKCAVALQSIGFLAVTSSGGCKAANATDWKPLSGRIRIILVPDNDEAGMQYVQDVAAILAALEEPPGLFLMTIPDMSPGGDVVDWIYSKLSDLTSWDGYQPVPESEKDMLANDFQKLIDTFAVPVQDAWKFTNKSEKIGTWPDPISLDAAPLPPWPKEVFPPEVQCFVEGLSQATETPVELASMIVLAVLAAAVQGKFQICVKNGYFEPLALWTCVALPPGTRKTAIFTSSTEPLRKWEQDKRKSMEESIKKAESEHKTFSARIAKLRQKASGKDGAEFEKLLEQINRLEMQLPEIPKAPQIWCADITPENLGTVMSDNHEKMAILSDEGGIFEIMAGRYSKGVPNLDIFLQSHAGAPVRVNRGSRPPVFMQNPTLTMGLAIQPDVVRGLFSKPGFHGRGLLGRFLFAVPPSNLGFRTGSTPSLFGGVKISYSEIITATLNLPLNVGPDGISTQYTLTLEKEALDLWNQYWGIVEKKMRDDGQFANLSDWAGKLPGAVARIAGCLHVAKHAMGCPWDHHINEDTMEAAIRLGEVLEAHALAAFDLMGADPAIENARIVLKWLIRKGELHFTFRDCHYSHKNRFRRADELEPALEILTERHFIRPHAQKDKVAYRPSRVFEVNPAIIENNQTGENYA
ncbi:MAG: DUF3987 domain-containing protein [Magnetococcales bacterium]|nr:DUF3987 domain-containing protein [Magnetococcales bacterium]